jgi:hypothetical protein
MIILRSSCAHLLFILLFMNIYIMYILTFILCTSYDHFMNIYLCSSHDNFMIILQSSNDHVINILWSSYYHFMSIIDDTTFIL